MGMFDDVVFEVPCPACNTIVRGFQSKDGECMMERLRPRDVRNFYASCPTCKTWIEYQRWSPSVPDGVETIDGCLFERTARPAY